MATTTPVTRKRKIAPKTVAKPTTTRTPAKPRTAKPPAHPLAGLVAAEWYGEDYISRQLGKFTDIELLDYARKTKENVLIFGPTGPGKTSCIMAYSAIHKIPIVTIGCNGALDPASLFSRPVSLENGAIDYEPSDVYRIMEFGGIIQIDEANFAPPRIMSVFQSALDKRREVTIPDLGYRHLKLHPDCQFVATYNPGYEGTKPLNKSFRNRFSIKVEFDYSRTIEEQLVTGVPELLNVADKLRAAVKSGDLETPVSTNMIQEFEVHAVNMGVDLAMDIFLNAFHDHERAPVREVIEHHIDVITAQVHVIVGNQEG